MKTLFGGFKGLKSKLLLMAFIPIGVLILLAILSNISFSKIAGLLAETDQVTLPIIINSHELAGNTHSFVQYAMLAVTSENAEDRKKYLEQTKDDFKDMSEAVESLDKTKMSEYFPIQWGEIKKLWPEVSGHHAELIELINSNTPESNKKAKDYLYGKLGQNLIQISLFLDQVGNLQNENLKNSEIDHKKSMTFYNQLILIFSLLGAFLSLAGAITIGTRLSRVLSETIEHLKNTSSEVTGAADHLSKSSESLSSGATETASSLEETVSSLEELSSMVRLNADHAKEAASLSSASSQSAETGETEIRDLVSAMKDIKESSKKIEEIINVIDDIAFQTNLLALNASVEAARAGEHGKGFAVVADAVRSLAQRSAVAAKDITTLIQDSVRKIEKGTNQADSSGETLKTIVTSIRKVADLNTEIATASSEQANGIANINQAMNDIDASTQQNASSAEEVSSASTELSSQSDNLKTLVHDLIHLVHGSEQNAKSANESLKMRLNNTGKNSASESHKPNLKLVKNSTGKSGSGSGSGSGWGGSGSGPNKHSTLTHKTPKHTAQHSKPSGSLFKKMLNMVGLGTSKSAADVNAPMKKSNTSSHHSNHTSEHSSDKQGSTASHAHEMSAEGSHTQDHQHLSKNVINTKESAKSHSSKKAPAAATSASGVRAVKSKAAELIPFDEDVDRKVGGTDGF